MFMNMLATVKGGRWKVAVIEVEGRRMTAEHGFLARILRHQSTNIILLLFLLRRRRGFIDNIISDIIYFSKS